MAINPDYFIFHSGLLFEQRVNKVVGINVAVSGTIGASATGVYTSSWYNFRKSGSTVRGRVYVPGQVYYPSVTNAEFPTPVSLIYDNLYANFIARIEVEATRYRCVVFVPNPYDFAIASPGRTFVFTVREYLPA